MNVTKIGYQIVVTDPTEFPGAEFDITSMHARSRVSTEKVVITDLANPNNRYSCAVADFTGDSASITDPALIKAFLREIIGS